MVGFIYKIYNMDRRTKFYLYVGLAIMLVHIIASATVIHMVLISFMGHGMEIIIACVFIRRAITGKTVAHDAERHLYGIWGMFIIIYNLMFAYGLLFNYAKRARYLVGKMGILNDFVQIAREQLHVSLNSVLWFYMFYIVFVVVLTLVFIPKRDLQIGSEQP